MIELICWHTYRWSCSRGDQTRQKLFNAFRNMTQGQSVVRGCKTIDSVHKMVTVCNIMSSYSLMPTFYIFRYFSINTRLMMLGDAGWVKIARILQMIKVIVRYYCLYIYFIIYIFNYIFKRCVLQYMPVWTVFEKAFQYVLHVCLVICKQYGHIIYLNIINMFKQKCLFNKIATIRSR